jgi:hypothetical protein
LLFDVKSIRNEKGPVKGKKPKAWGKRRSSVENGTLQAWTLQMAY